MAKITITKDGIYKEVEDTRLPEFKEKGFIELDESGKPRSKAESKNIKELKAELAEISKSHKVLMVAHEELETKYTKLQEENAELLKTEIPAE